MTGPHRFSCALRWGDLDLLGHTNNVRYLDYVQQARLALLADCGIAGLAGPVGSAAPAGTEQAVVVRHDVSFDAPLMFREQPVTVTSRVVETGAATVVVEQVVLDEPGDGAAPPDGEPLVYFRARSRLCVLPAPGERPRRLTDAERDGLAAYAGETVHADLAAVAAPTDQAPAGATAYPVEVRWSDVDAYRHVGNVEQVQYLQEARLRMLGLERWAGHAAAETGAGASEGGGFDNLLVVAATTLSYDAPMAYRRPPYEVRSWVSRVGGGSFDVSSVVVDPDTDDAVLARGRVVLVAFDPGTQRSTRLTDSSRAALERLRG